mmetsp:Transcript_15729/g.18165  ORF Transcript_15729/g.18165 Transcript_15729/m.18165 type:complete len:305 (+) Transcript_15729:1153-2067(+)
MNNNDDRETSITKRSTKTTTTNILNRRSFLSNKVMNIAASSLLLTASSTSSSSAAAATKATAAATNVNNKDTFVYFGTGCFWHIQNEFIKAERSLLKRKEVDLTSRTGYAGRTKVDSKGRVCYLNLQFAGDYGRMGHAEVVGMTIPESKIGDFAKIYFNLFDPDNGDRVDPGDKGREYRYLLGLPDGDQHPKFDSIVEAAKNNPTGKKLLVKGKGSDPDTFKKNIVYYYDTNQFPFYQAEKYHQFHNDFRGPPYGQDYNQLVDLEFSGGKILKTTGCPDSFDEQTKLRTKIKQFKQTKSNNQSS